MPDGGAALNGKPLNDDTLSKALSNALIAAGAAQGANAIGDAASGVNGNPAQINAFTQSVAHALLGCAIGSASAGSGAGCSPGAVGAVVGELSAKFYNPDGKGNAADTVNFAKTMASLVGAMSGGGTAAVSIASMTGGNAAENNELLHQGGRVTALTRSGYTLEGVQLPGVGETYLDPRMATAVSKWLDLAKAQGVNMHFNSAFRISGEAVSGAVFTPAGDTSLHNAGLAVDIRYDRLADISGGLSGDEQRSILRTSAAAAGLSWGGSFGDRVHFYNDPYGKADPNRSSLIETQQEAYRLLKK